MRMVLIALIALVVMPAYAADPAVVKPTEPVVSIPAAPAMKSGDKAGFIPFTLTPAQKAKVAERAAVIQKQLNDLSPAEQQEVMKQVKPARVQLTDEQRKKMGEARFSKTEFNWLNKSPEDKAELRDKTRDNWIKLPANQKSYQRDKMVEKLKALPDEDRKQIIEAAGK